MKLIQNTFILILCIAGTVQIQPAQADMLNLRDQRYCEILLGDGGFILPNHLDVYNTIGLKEGQKNSGIN